MNKVVNNSLEASIVDAFQSVLAVYIDENNRMWVLD